VAIVTGGTQGIGAAIAMEFARTGTTPVIAGRDRAVGLRTAALIKKATGVETVAIQADLSVGDECENLIATVAARLGRIDALVNNAAFFSIGSLIEVKPSTIADTMALNFTAALLCGREFARHAIESQRAGSIVNVSSVNSAAATPDYGLYSASKAALDSLTRSMAVEWGRHKLTVNGVAPGHVATKGVLDDVKSGRLNLHEMISRTSVGRIAEPEDIARVVVFLTTEDARHIAGQTIIVDGGQRATL
jgi:NAD(P)-dependent dehydrogenase (short-subunit alcohol dehydrogenase family)